MKGAIAIAVAVILIAASLPYGYQIARRHVVPTLSTWIIFVVATSLNVVSYLVATRGDVRSGALGLADATVGCSATIQRLLYANKNPESFLFWGLVLVAATLSLYPAAVAGNLLALIYSIRSIVIVGVILSLMVRVRQRS